MLDESMFEDIHEIAENSAYLKAVEEKDVSLEMLEQLPPYEDLKELEEQLRAAKLLTFQAIFMEPTGYYMIKCFLIADYAVDKAIFIKDVEAYKSMRFESARRKIAKLLYQRFVSQDPADSEKFAKGSSVFHIMRGERGQEEEKLQQQQAQQQAQQQQQQLLQNTQHPLPPLGQLGQPGMPPSTPQNPAHHHANTNIVSNSPAAVLGAPGMMTPIKSLDSGTGAGGTVTPLRNNTLPNSPNPNYNSPNPNPSNNNNNNLNNLDKDKINSDKTSNTQGTSLADNNNNNKPPLDASSAPNNNLGLGLGLGGGPGSNLSNGSSGTSARDVISPNTVPSSAGPNLPRSSLEKEEKKEMGTMSMKKDDKDYHHAAHPNLTVSSANTHQKQESILQMGNSNNAIGVYGKIVKKVKERVNRGEAPKDLFDEVGQQVMNDLKLDVFPRFKQSEFYKKYIRTKWIETMKVSIKDFTTFRVLGRGGFGAVHACRKTNSGTLYAMKCINKRLVQAKSALDNVLEERNVLTMMKSNFVTNLKYALQDEESLYLIMDLMLGGDLKFHLINAGRFTEKRARFYAAEVLLGLEHVHNASIIYRDMKLENVLLDHSGHCRISDLGLAVVTKTKIKGYAGTPGYTAPEMIKNKLYGPSADIFSYGVMLYRMLCGSKPFKGKIDRELDKAVTERKPTFPKEIFSKEAIALLTGLLQKRPENRLGCGEKGIEEIKDHPFFESIDWGLLEAGYIDPPFIPNKFDVNAASLKDIGDFDKAKYKNTKITEKFKQRLKNFHWVSIKALQDEMVSVLEKADENVNFEKFAVQQHEKPPTTVVSQTKCCVIL